MYIVKDAQTGEVLGTVDFPEDAFIYTYNSEGKRRAIYLEVKK
jgi:hypothetical protein